MRAAQSSGLRSRVEVVEMPVPEVRESEALIRISASYELRLISSAEPSSATSGNWCAA